MAFIPAPNTVKVTLSFLWAGQIVEMTLAVRKASAWDTSEMDDLAAVVKTWWDSSLKNLMSSVVGFTNINLLDMTTDSSPSIDYPVSPVEFGANGTGSVQNNVSLVTSFKTDKRGRSYRGRSYMVGVPGNAIFNSGTATAAYSAGLVASWLALVAAFVGNAWEHVVVSRYHDLAARLVADIEPITAYSVELNFDSQRRRLVGRGM